MSTFKDHFSSNATDYSLHRPAYPEALFTYLASIAPHNNIAWDCATGTGQAAKGLTKYFNYVLATDASQEQINNTLRSDGVTYLVSTAENTPLITNSIDLITIAQAIHWFDTRQFFKEAKRILKPDGIVAYWTYNLFSISPEINEIIFHLYTDILAPYWPPERRIVEEGYRSIVHPFTEVQTPPFDMSGEWNLHQLIGYLGTWSAVKRYINSISSDPVDIIIDDLSRAWGETETKKAVKWPLSIKIGKK